MKINKLKYHGSKYHNDIFLQQLKQARGAGTKESMYYMI